MNKFFILTIILVLGAWGKVAAQDAAAASKRANQQYVLFESERDKGTNVTGMYGYLLDSYENFMKVVEAPDNGQYLSGAKNRLRAMYPYLLNGAVYYSEQKQPAKALDFAAAYIEMPRLKIFQSELLPKDNRYASVVYYAAVSAYTLQKYSQALKYFQEYLNTGTDTPLQLFSGLHTLSNNNAFVLRYSVSQNCPVEEVYTNAFAEAQEAMDYLHQNAGDLHIDPEQIAVVGFSAGGHLAASVGTMGRVRPAAMLLGYAVFSVPGKALGMELPDLLQQVDDQTPPTFLFATQGDHLVPATQSLQFATLLAEQKIPYEMHIFAYGDHGFSTGSRHIANPQNPENPESAVWQGMALGFLNHIFNHDVLVPAPEEVKEFCLDMKIGTLLDTPQSAALIQQLLPELAQYVQQEPGSRGISVNDLQFYSNKMFDEEKLAALNEALVKLN